MPDYYKQEDNVKIVSISAAVAAAIIGLAGCGQAASAPEPISAPVSSPAPAPSSRPLPIFTGPLTDASVDQYVVDVRNVDPRLVATVPLMRDALRLGRETCNDIQQVKTDPTVDVTKRAQLRWAGGTLSEVDVESIVISAASTLCVDLGVSS